MNWLSIGWFTKSLYRKWLENIISMHPFLKDGWVQQASLRSKFFRGQIGSRFGEGNKPRPLYELKMMIHVFLLGGWTTHLENSSQHGNFPQVVWWFISLTIRLIRFHSRTYFLNLVWWFMLLLSNLIQEGTYEKDRQRSSLGINHLYWNNFREKPDSLFIISK